MSYAVDHPAIRRPQPQVETVTPMEPVFHPPEPLPVWAMLRIRGREGWGDRIEVEAEALAWAGQCVLVTWRYPIRGRDRELVEHWIDAQWIRHRTGTNGSKPRPL